MDFSAVIAIPQIKTIALSNYLVLIAAWTDVERKLFKILELE